MNRRKFFGMTLGALAAAGLPEILMPHRTLFLPPQFGWKPHELGSMYMREVVAYSLHDDLEFARYDAIGRDIWGREELYHVDMDFRTPEEMRIEVAKKVIGDSFAFHGLSAVPVGQSREFHLSLPRGFAKGRYL